MKVILLKDIARLGKRGDVKDVADGYAMNVLVRNSQALRATPEELSKWKQKEESKLHKKELATNTFTQVIDALSKKGAIISGKKVDPKGQLFAQVKETDIVDAIFKASGISIDPKQVIIPTAIKRLGIHTALLKQGTRTEKIHLEIK